MADFPNAEESPYTAEVLHMDFDTYAATPNPFLAIALVPPTVTYYKMRALADPGPGYVTWVVTTTPDFAGTSAPDPIQSGTVVIADRWQ